MKRVRRPPALAVWMLSRLLRARTSEAFVGDLLEEYQGGRSRSWYWRQVFWAVAAELRRQPPRCFGPGALRLLLIAAVIVGASIDAKWPLFLLALDPSWPLLVRWQRQHRRKPPEHQPCAR